MKLKLGSIVKKYRGILEFLGVMEQGKINWGSFLVLALVLVWIALPGMGAGAWALRNWSFLDGIDEGLLQSGFLIGCGILGLCVFAFSVMLFMWGVAEGDASTFPQLILGALFSGFLILPMPILGGVYLLSFIEVF